MRQRLIYILLFVAGFAPQLAHAYTIDSNQDTIPPIFTVPPSSLTVLCEASDLETTFTNWYQSQAGAEADNGTASVLPTIPLVQAVDSLNNLRSNLCINGNALTLEFFALDSCGNRSNETLSANFSITDTEKPQILSPATDKDLYCTATVSDSLQAWIAVQGGAVVTDECSATSWSNYIWNDNLGNSGFNDFTDSSGIVIHRVDCTWNVTVSFFVEDACGNDNVTTAMFSIIGDTLAPVLQHELRDTFLLCDQMIPVDSPTILDECDGELLVTQVDSTTQSLSPDSCSHYNYEIISTWIGEDACGNNIETSRTITVRDTIAPQISFNSTVALDCSQDISDLSYLLMISDACSQPTISFKDSILFDSNCQDQFLRTWFVSDFCGNVDSVQQTIQIQDFTGPEFLSDPIDLNISCDNSQLSVIFDQWILDNSQGISDGCNGYAIKVLPPGNYTDTLEIQATPELILADLICEKPDSLGVVAELEAYYVAYDLCGNITEKIASFKVTDVEQPNITDCPSDLDIQVNPNQCNADYTLVLPSFTDNCLVAEDAEWVISVNGISLNTIGQQSIPIVLDIGAHAITYVLEDCGQNTSLCSQIVNVTDNTQPTLLCPEDIIIYAAEDGCDSELIVPELEGYADNCFGIKDYEHTLPDGQGFIYFTYNSFEDLYQGTDFPLEFPNTSYNGLLHSPHLILEYKLSLQDNSEISIVSELGQLIHRFRNETCSDENLTISLDPTDFEGWAADGTVRLVILNQANGDLGTSPCDPDNISGTVGQDDSSYLRVTLAYSSLVPETNLTNDVTGSSIPIIDSQNVSTGSYTLSYQVNDASGNSSQCDISVMVLDTISPEITCQSITYELDLLQDGLFQILETDLSFVAQDNCEYAVVDFDPKQIFCDDENVPYTITVTDPSGNLSTCNSTIQISKPELTPTFVSGLCLADTLKFLSNISDTTNFTFQWTGPDGFSSQESDPIITGINDNSSGDYILIATSSNGCSYSGSVEIDVQLFDSPEIFSNLTTICDGETLLLNTNSFTEIVEYFWYEGISPNGTLLMKTDGPSLALEPAQGQHFYYVEVKGDNCNSNPSITLEVNVSMLPQAEISQPFITACEGGEIILMTNVFDPNYQYEWSGPDNYNSTGQFPDVIDDVTESNQGTYTLITIDGECVSDTATAQVEVFPQPPFPFITGESIYCEGQSAVLTVPNVPNGTNYQWFNNGVFYSAGSSNSLLIPAISQSESGNWTVLVEEVLCTSDTSNVFPVNIESALSIGATNDGPVCEGDSVTLTSSFIPGATYKWTDPTGSTHDGRIITVLAEAGVYTVEVTTPSSCTARTTTVVEVGLKPAITALSNTSLPCMSGDNPVTFVFTVFPPGNYQYNWVGPNGFSSNLEDPVIQNFNETNNGTYTLTVLNADCESEPISNTINITLTPPTPIINVFSTPCLGDDVTFTITNPISGLGTEWLWSTPTGQVTTTSPELTLMDFQNIDSGTYSVQQLDNGCRSLSSAPVDVLLQTAPLTPLISGDNIACEGEDVILSVDISNADSYLWFTPTGTTTESTNELFLPNVSIQNAGAYSVFISTGNCVSDTSLTFSLQVNPLPSAPHFLVESLELCTSEMDSLEICLEEIISPIDEIRLIDLETLTTLQSDQDNCLDLSFLLDSPGNYSIGITSSLAGCTSEIVDTLKLNIYDLPNLGGQVLDEVIYVCGRDFVNIQSENIPSETELLWYSDDPELNIFDQNNLTVSVSNLRTGDNNLFLSSSSGSCENYFIDTILVVVIEEPEASDDFLSLPFGQELVINPLQNDNYEEGINLSIIDTPQKGEANVSGNRILYMPEQSLVGDDEIGYQICYDNCPDLCDEATIFLTVGEEVECFVGNIVTPNGDGYNDALTVPCLESGNYLDNSILIFNEWGDEVYNSAPYQNDWQGTYNGKLLPVGTYFYILDLGDGSKPIQGFLILEL